MASASIPLIMMLRHIFIAEARPISTAATSSAMPAGPSIALSRGACLPPSRIGTFNP